MKHVYEIPMHCNNCRYEITKVGDDPCKKCHAFQYWDTKMTANEYQEAAMRTAPVSHTENMLANCALGLTGEAGEAADLIKKHLFHGHNLDEVHLAKELGDVMWYVAVMAETIGYDLQTILEMNIEKLRERYPDGFDPEKSQNRKEGDV